MATENVMLAHVHKNQTQNLVAIANKVMNKESIDIDRVLVKDARTDRSYFLNKDGSRNMIDEALTQNNLEKYYTYLRGKGDDNPFVFEKEVIPEYRGIIGRMRKHWMDKNKD